MSSIPVPVRDRPAPARTPLSLRAWIGALAVAASALFAAPAIAGPYNTTSEGGESRVMLRGHDPVGYFTQGRHVPGKPALRSVHDGVTYWFASAEHKAMFDREPAKYAPQYGGYCTNGIAYAIPWGGDPDVWKIIDGKLYIFGGEASRRYFLMDEAANHALARKYWSEEVDGSIGIVQRFWRLIFRVPHYKSGKELETEYQRRLKAGEIRSS